MISIPWNTKPNQLSVGAVLETSKAAPDRLGIKKGSRSYSILTTPSHFISCRAMKSTARDSNLSVGGVSQRPPAARCLWASPSARFDWKSVRQLSGPENTESKALSCICCPQSSSGSSNSGAPASEDLVASPTSQPHRLEIGKEEARSPSGARTSRTHSIYQETRAKSPKSSSPYRIQNLTIIRHEITIHTSLKHLHPPVHPSYHHTNTLYHTVPDITAIDYPEQSKRFEVVHNLLSPFYNNRIHVKTLVDEITPSPSSTSTYNGSN
jgi:hypothetical protein